MNLRLLLLAALLIDGCAMPGFGGYGGGYGYPGYRYPTYGNGFYPGYGWNGYPYGYNYGYDQARREDWRRWQAYQYGLGRGGQSGGLPYGITPNQNGTYRVPGHGDFTPGQIQNWARKHRR
jgi:hypothetical protein